MTTVALTPARLGAVADDVVARSVGLSKVYGRGDATVVVLDDVTVGFGRSLVSRPAIVFADEPARNLDSRASTEMLAFPRRSVDELGSVL